jgi:hypothetical protein
LCVLLCSVYLRTDPEVAFERTQLRARKEERRLTLQYMKKLHDLHEDWLINQTKFSCPAPVSSCFETVSIYLLSSFLMFFINSNVTSVSAYVQHTHTHTHIHTYICTCVHTSTYIRTYIHTHTHTYICMYIHISSKYLEQEDNIYIPVTGIIAGSHSFSIVTDSEL